MTQEELISKIRKEINRRMDEQEEMILSYGEPSFAEGAIDALHGILDFIDSIVSTN